MPCAEGLMCIGVATSFVHCVARNVSRSRFSPTKILGLWVYIQEYGRYRRAQPIDCVFAQKKWKIQNLYCVIPYPEPQGIHNEE